MVDNDGSDFRSLHIPRPNISDKEMFSSPDSKNFTPATRDLPGHPGTNTNVPFLALPRFDFEVEDTIYDRIEASSVVKKKRFNRIVALVVVLVLVVLALVATVTALLVTRGDADDPKTTGTPLQTMGTTFTTLRPKPGSTSTQVIDTTSLNTNGNNATRTFDHQSSGSMPSFSTTSSLDNTATNAEFSAVSDDLTSGLTPITDSSPSLFSSASLSSSSSLSSLSSSSSSLTSSISSMSSYSSPASSSSASSSQSSSSLSSSASNPSSSSVSAFASPTSVSSRVSLSATSTDIDPSSSAVEITPTSPTDGTTSG